MFYRLTKGLLKHKISRLEIDTGPMIEVLNSFIDDKIKYFDRYADNLNSKSLLPHESLDRLFRKTIKTVFDD